ELECRDQALLSSQAQVRQRRDPCPRRPPTQPADHGDRETGSPARQQGRPRRVDGPVAGDHFDDQRPDGGHGGTAGRPNHAGLQQQAGSDPGQQGAYLGHASVTSSADSISSSSSGSARGRGCGTRRPRTRRTAPKTDSAITAICTSTVACHGSSWGPASPGPTTRKKSAIVLPRVIGAPLALV